jgi:aminoglycoside phosphotransferase (APT) family kinase protein
VVTNRLAAGDEAGETGRLGAALRSAWPLTTPTRLLHGDFWPGNWLWKAGLLQAVIDWEDAALGDPLADLAVSRLDARLIFGEAAMHEFTRHYRASTATDFANLPFWDVYAALRAAPNLADWAAGFPALGRGDLTEATLRETHAAFTAVALETLDAAKP